jgi:hypothetical protein
MFLFTGKSGCFAGVLRCLATLWIEFDRLASYTHETESLLRRQKLIELSKDEPLFGRSWNNEDDAQ